MKKSFVAFAIAFLITSCVAAAIFAIGGSALINQNSVPVSNSRAQPAVGSAVNASPADQVGQLQELVSQYQAREQQLQQQIEQANARIQQDQQTLQQVQLLLATLQQRGLIALTNDGQIVITQ